MSICIYKTDNDWSTFIKTNSITERVNFWRFNQDDFTLPVHEFFYFRRWDENAIIGRGRLVSYAKMSIQKAWDTYQINCGAPSLIQLMTSLKRIYEDRIQDEQSDIQAIELRSIEWLAPNRDLQLSEEIFHKSAQYAFRNNFSEEEELNINKRFANAFRR